MEQPKARCKICGETKPLERFATDPGRKSGFKTWCKACDRERSRRYYAKNKEKRRAYDRARYKPRPRKPRKPQPKKAPVVVACPLCGGLFEERDRTKGELHYCSLTCLALQRRKHWASSVPWAECEGCGTQWIRRTSSRRCDPCRARTLSRPGPACPLKYRGLDTVEYQRQQPRHFISGYCSRCGEGFTTHANCYIGNGHCSKRCNRAHQRELERVSKREAFVANVYRQEIYERDNWRCQLCGKAVKRKAQVPDLLAPTIDHIIPLSLGGTHEPANTQLAHFGCNAKKSNRLTGDQLRLVG